MALQLRTHIKKEGVLELSLAEVPIPEPKADEVVIRIEAAPVNPSDLGLLIGPADVKTSRRVGGNDARPVVNIDVPAQLMAGMTLRLDKSLPCGNEGSGVVVKAGTSDAARALLGKVVGVIGGNTYQHYVCANVKQCLAFPEGTTAEDCASWFVNPLTALGFVETMRQEGFTALVHTAAASNLGQMLVKICIKDGIDLVNIVRKQEHADLLKSIGAKHVVLSSSKSFMKDLTSAIAETKAYLAFDAIGGGKLAGQILTCMEQAANRTAGEYNRYGSAQQKQCYIYGGLDTSPTVLNRNFGLQWKLGGWLLTPFMQKTKPETVQQMRSRVAAEITTTFSSKYFKHISLAEALDVETIKAYQAKATGEKYLIDPSKGVNAASKL